MDTESVELSTAPRASAHFTTRSVASSLNILRELNSRWAVPEMTTALKMVPTTPNTPTVAALWKKSFFFTLKPEGGAGGGAGVGGG